MSSNKNEMFHFFAPPHADRPISFFNILTCRILWCQWTATSSILWLYL